MGLFHNQIVHTNTCITNIIALKSNKSIQYDKLFDSANYLIIIALEKTDLLPDISLAL